MIRLLDIGKMKVKKAYRKANSPIVTGGFSILLGFIIKMDGDWRG